MEITKNNNYPLTGQEIRILELIAECKKSREISRILSISHLTVKTHRQRILQKFHAHNFSEVINKANKSGFI
jgi:DNA-binding CsgD family transcriptional regulator